MINFKPLEPEILPQVIDMQADSEKDNLYAIIDWSFEPDSFARVIFDDNTPIGFMIYNFIFDKRDYISIKRFVIDRRLKDKGYEDKAMEAAFILFREEFPSAEYVELINGNCSEKIKFEHM